VGMLSGPVRHELFALRLADGRVAWHRVVDPPGASPRVHQQRGSLNLANGRVYFSYGGFAGDCGRYNGWVMSAPANGAGPLNGWEVPSNVGGAVWAPPGPVISPTGDVWVSTGNTLAGAGATSGTYDGANAVVRLDPRLSAAIDRWAPENWVELNNADLDLGSLAPALLPGGLVFAAGKDGVGYLLREAHLGGIGGQVFKATVCQRGATHAAFGGAAVASGMVLVPCKDGLVALRVDASAPSFTVAWRGAPGANSAVLAYGLAWTVTASGGNGSQDVWSGSLLGLDPASGAVKVRLALGGIPHFAAPAAAGGHVYVGGLGTVYAVSVA
jgi:polyvinyl alcohol dehydrogenase (cytochrome)